MPRGDKLWQRIEAGTKPELENLSKIIGLAEPEQKDKAALLEELSAGIRTAAGHSVCNLFRRNNPHKFPYKQILIDVADKMAPGWTPRSWTKYRLDDAHSERDIERVIWKFFEDRMNLQIEKMPPQEREKLRANTAEELRRLGYNEAMISQVGNALVGGGLVTVITPALAYHIALSTASGLAWFKVWVAGTATTVLLLGTGAWVFSVLYAPGLVWWLGNTAYRKTVPAVLELIKIRKLRELEKTLG